MAASDWPRVRRIYAEGIAGGHATFEAQPPEWDAFDAGRLPAPRLVAVGNDDEALGWVAASPVSARAVYCGVVEHSIYIADEARGRGIGAILLGAFLAETDAAGIWTVQSSIFPENLASLRLHARHGFRTVGTRERIALMSYGPMAGVWRDTILIERRAPSGGES
ncbi:GNAT family N-acetyltransferase [Homoserinibacter sp. GY 40078]|uniref:GNAT family N-acetyltransferase n=1 Tax=Homoserinibacter sp. GY 40078 TaxID=2603275 RepID=UPI0011C9E26A|nr:GNAT family N-acetyltransferase [Homoserinibacter sp. GY 40078]TXK17852.1 N-acetyltransferase [Homoserinibacter sp. GY 40078]